MKIILQAHNKQFIDHFEKEEAYYNHNSRNLIDMKKPKNPEIENKQMYEKISALCIKRDDETRDEEERKNLKIEIDGLIALFKVIYKEVLQ